MFTSLSEPRRVSDRGAVAAEFALILPVLLILFFAIIQFSIAFNRQQAVHAAARECARIASLPSTTSSEVSARVTAALTGITFENAPTCDVTGNCAPGGTDSVSALVEGVTLLDIPFWGSQSLTLTGRGSFRCE